MTKTPFNSFGSGGSALTTNDANRVMTHPNKNDSSNMPKKAHARLPSRWLSSMAPMLLMWAVLAMPGWCQFKDPKAKDTKKPTDKSASKSETKAAPKAVTKEELPTAVREAIKKGIERIWEDQDEGGGWAYDKNAELAKGPKNKDHRAVGMTALNALALYENGAQLSDAKLRKALDFIRETAPTCDDTYSVALATTVLSRIGFRRDKQLVANLVTRLLHSQKDTGGWHYTTKRLGADEEVTARVTRRDPGLGDLSVTQFVVLALYQAQRFGVDVGDSLQLARHRLAWAQTDKGGWSYPGLPDQPENASMTTAGTYMYIVCSAVEIKRARASKKERIMPLEPKPRAKERESDDEPEGKTAKKKKTEKPAVDIYEALHRDGMEYRRGIAEKEKKEKDSLEDKYVDKKPTILSAVAQNPLYSDEIIINGLKRVTDFAKGQVASVGGPQSFYYLWSIERLGVLLGEDKFGDVNWYTVGSERAIKSQHEDGSWGVKSDDAEANKGHYRYGPDTAFTLLFLKKANLGSEVTRMIKPDPDSAFFFADDPSQRFKTLKEAVALAKEKQTIVVQGDGPYPVGGLVIDKPVTIQGMLGYLPVLEYSPPTTKSGLQADVTKDPDASAMFLVRGGPVVLEGLSIRFDAPVVGNANWRVAETNANAYLQLLNCTVSSTTSKKPVKGLVINDSVRTFARNCLFMGLDPVVTFTGDKPSKMLIKDVVAFAPTFVHSTNKAGTDIFLMESSLDTNVCFDLPATGPVAITSERNVLQAKTLVKQLSENERSWDGLGNLYAVRNWVAEGPEKAMQVPNLKGWRAYWKAEESHSREGVAPFQNPKNGVGPFRHETSAQDWALKEEVIERIMLPRGNEQFGANAYSCGSGLGYSQFRENIEYASWLKVKPPSQRTEE